MWAYRWIDERTYTTDTVVTYSYPYAICDSVVTLTLTVYPTYEFEDHIELCQSALPLIYCDTMFDETTTSGHYEIVLSTQDGCDSTITLDLTVHPSEETQLHMVTVQWNQCHVQWKKKKKVVAYNIYREGTGVDPYSLVYTAAYDEEPLWVDESSNARYKVYRYKISSVDVCGVESPLSDAHASIHLMISQGVNHSFNLQWSHYEGASRSAYKIYRGPDEQHQELIDVVPASNTSYSDFDAPDDNVYYSVTAVLDDGTKAESEVRSNIVTPEDIIGIESVEDAFWQLRSDKGMLLISGVEGKTLHIYDAYGRLLKSIERVMETERYEVPASGLYIVKPQGGVGKKVTVLK